MRLVLLLLACITFGMYRSAKGISRLSFQLLNSQGPEFDYSDFIPAIDLALELINANHTVLPGYELRYTEIIDPQCTITKGVHGFIQHVTMNATNDTEIMVIGGVCSVATQPVASLAPLWNLVQISPSSSSPRLSDQKAFPTFLRLVPPDDTIAAGIIQIMHYFEWKYIAILTQEEDIFTLTRDALIEQILEEKFTLIHTVSFPTGKSPQRAVNSLKKSSGRIIFLNSYPEYAIEILCQALILGMTPPDYAWITFGWFSEDFWTENFTNRTDYNAFDHCTPAEMRKIVNKMMFVDQYPRHDKGDDDIIIGNLSKANYTTRFKEKRLSVFGNVTHTDHERDSTFAYDTVWMAALALHRTEIDLQGQEPSRSLNNFTYHSKDIQEIIYRHALNTRFNGASGYVKILGNGDRVAELRLYQMSPSLQGDSELERQNVGHVDDNGTLYISDTKKPLFGGDPPRSHIHRKIHVGLFITYTVLSGAGVIFAVVCLIFNLIYRNKGIVKLSSPYLNIIFIAGIILTYLLVVVSGIDDSLVDVSVVSGLCQTTVWIMVIAFTLVYGVVLAKTFKVFYIFKNLRIAKPEKKKTVQDWHMFLLIAILLSVDIVFLIVVTAVRQTILTVQLTPLPINAGELPNEVYLCTSENSHIWIPILVAYKAVEVVFSLIFAFETRKIKVKELNDSRMVIFSVYIIVVAFIALAAIYTLASDRVTIRYSIVGVTCLALATSLLGINFIPKMYRLYKDPSGIANLDFSDVASNLSKDSKKKQVTRDRTASGEIQLSCKNGDDIQDKQVVMNDYVLSPDSQLQDEVLQNNVVVITKYRNDKPVDRKFVTFDTSDGASSSALCEHHD